MDFKARRQESKNNLVYLQADKCILVKTLDTKKVFSVSTSYAYPLIAPSVEINNNKINLNSNAKQRICQSNRRIACPYLRLLFEFQLRN